MVTLFVDVRYLVFNAALSGSVEQTVGVLRPQMFLELAADAELGEAVSADVRLERAADGVTVHVLAQVLGAGERLGTRRAGVRLVAVVQLDVTSQVPDPCEQHLTDAALELHHAVDVTHVVRLRVLHVVCLHCTQREISNRSIKSADFVCQ